MKIYHKKNFAAGLFFTLTGRGFYCALSGEGEH